MISYDAVDRVISAADPDDSAAGVGICSKSGTQPGWSTAETTVYYADGSVASRQSAYARSSGISTAYTYDLDGDQASETHHYGCLTASGCVPGLTKKWYDGADRLVEVTLPFDGWDIQGYPWSTRYVYDLSASGTVPYNALALSGHGNLVKTEEFLSGTAFAPYPIPVAYPPPQLPASRLDGSTSEPRPSMLLTEIPHHMRLRSATPRRSLTSTIVRATKACLHLRRSRPARESNTHTIPICVRPT